MFIHALEQRLLLSADEGAGLIVFNTNRDGNYEIYSMNPDGSELHNLTHNAATDAIPQVSDDGSKVAFASDRGHPGDMDIWLMDIDGSHLVNITHNALPGATNWDPAPSPDDSKVLYMGPKTGGGNYDIWVSDADGTHPRNLTNGLGGDFASWSDDGTKIVYGSYPSNDPNNEEIYWMNADGSNKTRVTNNPARDSYPAFSPDGQTIAFMTDRDGDREIYSCDLNGGNLKNLTQRHDSTDQVPYYSPDGKRISFISYRDGNGEIYVMNADGSNQTRITNDPAQDVYPGWGDYPELVRSIAFDANAPKQTVSVQFALDVNASLTKDDLKLTNTTTGQPVSASLMQMNYDPTSELATFTFAGSPNGALPDGNYTATLAAGSVADQVGHGLAEDEMETFFSLAGDANRDRVVNALDFDILASHYGSAGAKFTDGDFNYDGSITTADFAALAGQFGKSLPAPVMALALAQPAAAPTLFHTVKPIESSLLTDGGD